jgi:hypothetical protein
LEEVRTEAEEKHRTLGEALLDFAQEHGVLFDTADDALVAVSTFITDNKVPLLLQEALADSPLDRTDLPRKTTRTIARFITERCLTSAELQPILAGLVEGMVLQDALLFRDIATISHKFTGLQIVLDSPILFAVLDLTGVANGIATREGLSLFRDAGAVAVAFHRTLGEMRRILTVYENRVTTAEGRLSLYPTDLTRHVLTAKLSASDIRMISTTLEKRLAAHGIVIREVPTHDRRYTLDEQALAAILADDQDLDKPRIRHDVDCVAGVLTLRAGRTASSIENAHAVFCTTSGKVVRNVQRWYREEGEGGAPPAVHQLALTSIAWMKRPQAARGIKLHELAAICSAALKPSRDTWRMFIANVKQLRNDGVISDDETVAIIASEMTEPLLATLDDDFDPDADTIAEAIERVRASYRQEAGAAALVAIRQAQGEAALANEAATRALARSAALEALLDARIQRIATGISTLLFLAAALIVVLSAVLSVPGVFDSVGETWKWGARILLTGTTLFGAYATIYGPNLHQLRLGLRDRIAHTFRRRLTPSADSQSE